MHISSLLSISLPTLDSYIYNAINSKSAHSERDSFTDLIKFSIGQFAPKDADVVLIVRSVHSVPEPPNFSVLNFDHIDRVFPFRSASSRSLRRLRFSDFRSIFDSDPLLFKHVLEMLSNLDYVHALNLLAAFLVYRVSYPFWLSLLHDHGFLSSFDVYLKQASELNNILKQTLTSPLSRSYCELVPLAGYTALPYPGFDYFAEFNDLADGGRPIVSEFLHSAYPFDRYLTPLLTFPPATDIVFSSFDDFIRSGKWETSGASSAGKVSWSFRGVQGVFKARKNNVIDIFDPETVITKAKSSSAQTNKVLIKNELGKVRLAVSADLETYLQMSWITSLSGKFYKNWPGIVLEESVSDRLSREALIRSELRGRYSLPFDYKGFDRQPFTSELVLISQMLCSKAHLIHKKEEILDVSNKITKSFFHSILIGKDPLTSASYKTTVKGGLMSGLRWTSLVGSCWNLINTSRVTDLGLSLGMRRPVLSYVMGDDSLLVFDRAVDCAIMRLCFQMLSVYGSDLKMAILYQETEFLRVRFTTVFNTNYANRVIPSLNQRKPWASDPWSIDMVWQAVYNNLGSIARRSGNYVFFHEVWQSILRGIRSRTPDVFRRLLSPSCNGGCGLLATRQPMFTDTHATDTAVYSEFEFVVQPEWRRDLNRERCLNVLNFAPDDQVLDNYNKLSMPLKLASDDVIDIARLLRDSLRAISKRGSIVEAVKVSSIHMFLRVLKIHVYPKIADLSILSYTPMYFGADAALGAQLKLLSDLVIAGYVGPVSKDVLLSGRFDFLRRRQFLEHRGLSRSQAMSVLFGEFSVMQPGLIHPSLFSPIFICLVDNLLLDPSITFSQHKNSFFYFANVVCKLLTDIVASDISTIPSVANNFAS